MIFSSPSFLWALGLLAIPIIIHLFQFRRYKKLYFSDISLLKEVQSRSQTKNQLRHLLVLMARLLFVGALVMAFADPRIPGKTEITAEQPAVSIYVDNSFSMENQGENGRLLSTARQQAYEIAESYPSETRFQLITNDHGAAQGHFVDFESFLSQLDEVSTSANFQSINRIRSFHLNSKKESDLDQSVLYLLSDFVNNLDSLDGLNDTTTQLRAMPMQGLLTDNISIDSAWITTPVVQAGKEQELFFSITNRGTSLRSEVPVTFSLDGSVIHTASLTLEPDQSLDTSFSFIINAEGNLRGQLQAEDSPISFDNTYYFDLEVQPSIRIVEVGNAPQSPFEKLFDSEDYTYSRMQADRVRIDSTEGADLLILNGVERWSSGLFSMIDQMGAEGHSVLIALSDDMTADDRASFQTEFEIAIGNWDTTALEASELTDRDQLFQSVFESQPENLNFPTVSGHWKLNGSGAFESLITLFNGAPLLAVTDNGNGRVFIVTSPLEDTYTSFHRHALFVPAVINMALTSGLNQQLGYSIGTQKINLGQRTSETVRVQSRQDSTSFIPGIAYDGITLNNNVSSAGYYDLLDVGKRVETFSFNYDRQESSMRGLSPSQVIDVLQKADPTAEILDGDTANIRSAISEADLGKNLWPVFLALALAFVLFESVLVKLFSK